jgi:Kef-type K+ transport system membrane component KefB
VEQSTAISFVVVAAAAVLAPILAELLRKFRIPGVLFELLLGIAVGPAVLGWVELDPFISGLADFGLAMLFFMAGYEIDFRKLRGQPLNRAMTGWGISLALGLAVGGVLVLEGVVLSSLLVGLTLTTTAIGTLLPMLRDRGVLGTKFGDMMSAAGAVGEFGPVIAVTLLLSASKTSRQLGVLAIFIAVAIVLGLIARRPQSAKLVATLERHLTTSSQLPVRLLLLLAAGMVLLATQLGLDNLLGAVSAGIIARLALRPEQAHASEPKLDAVTFGFLIPVFFVVSGVKFNLAALGNFSTLIRVPIFLILLLVVRGLPALLVYRGVLSTKARGALAFLQATALPLLVVITEIGLSTNKMRPANAAALVGAGMLSVLLYPLIGFALLDRSEEMASLDPASQKSAD